jgi:phage shock protein PspC (stress-responsive transcriptional regulator)
VRKTEIRRSGFPSRKNRRLTMSDTVTETPTFDEAPPRRLVRTDDGRWLGGVCAGLGRYFDINPLVYRIAFAALALAGGTGVLLYIAAWLVIPGERSQESVAVETLRRHRDRPWLLLGVGLLSFGALLALSEARFWPDTGNLWLAATLGGAALLWWHVANRDRAPQTESSVAEAVPSAGEPAVSSAPMPTAPPAARPPARPSLFAPVLGALLAAAGLFGLLAVLDVYDVDVAVALAAGVAIVGGAIAIGALTQRRVGGLVFLGLVLLAAFGVAAMTPVSISSGVGDKNEQPETIAALQSSYELGMGELDLDLAAVTLPAGATPIDASVGIGSLVITVPEDVALEIDAHAGVGELDVLGERDEGINAQRTLRFAGATPDSPKLELEADVGIGNIEVRRG